MPDPAPATPKKPAGPMKYILLGCGILTGLFILGMGGCAGVFYFIYKGTDDIAAVGATYLQQSGPIQQAVGAPVSVKRDWMGWNVQVQNDRGNAHITYAVSGPASSGAAEVWLVKAAGAWTATGARFRPKNAPGDITIGTVPHARPFGKDWDD